MTDHKPLTTLQLTDIEAAIATYQRHAPTGFACCTAHPVADAGAGLLAEVRRLQAELADFSGRVNELESQLCQCQPVREHDDFRRPAFYQHEAHCPVTAAAAAGESGSTR